MSSAAFSFLTALLCKLEFCLVVFILFMFLMGFSFCVCVCVFDLWSRNVTFGYCFILPSVHLSVSRGNGTVPDVALMSTEFLQHVSGHCNFVMILYP